MELKLQKIGDGDTAIFTTLKKMVQFAREDSKDPIIKNIASQIKSKNYGKADEEYYTAKAVFDYVYNKVTYTEDEKIANDEIPNWNAAARTEFLTRPKYLLSETFRGDCDDMATACCALYLALGYRTTVKAIAWKDNDFSHVYSEVGLKTTFDEPCFIPCDPVAPKIGLGFGQEKTPVIRTKIIEV